MFFWLWPNLTNFDDLMLWKIVYIQFRYVSNISKQYIHNFLDKLTFIVTPPKMNIFENGSFYISVEISDLWVLTVDIFKSRIKKGRTKNATHFCVFWWICEIFWKFKKSKSSNIGQSNFWWYSDALKCRSGL